MRRSRRGNGLKLRYHQRRHEHPPDQRPKMISNPLATSITYISTVSLRLHDVRVETLIHLTQRLRHGHTQDRCTQVPLKVLGGKVQFTDATITLSLYPFPGWSSNPALHQSEIFDGAGEHDRDHLAHYLHYLHCLNNRPSTSRVSLTKFMKRNRMMETERSSFPECHLICRPPSRRLVHLCDGSRIAKRYIRIPTRSAAYQAVIAILLLQQSIHSGNTKLVSGP